MTERSTANRSHPGPDQTAHEPDTVEEIDPDVRQLLGLREPDSPTVVTADEVDTLGTMTDTRIYQGDLEARPPDSDQPDDGDFENIEMLTETELRDGETDDPNEAAEEGLAWVPPIDPPLRIDDDGPEVAAGFGTTAAEEPFDADHATTALPAHDEVEERVLQALRADSATAGLADALEIDAEGGVVRIAGVVDDLEDEDAIVSVAEQVADVVEVESRLVVRAVASTESGEA